MTKHYDIQWLTDSFEKGDALKFIYFWGHSNKFNEETGKFCFSQWFECPFTLGDKLYKTSEHWMMSQKALLFNDKQTFERILLADKPGEVKELGRQVTGFDEQVWSDKRFKIVKTGNIHKFNQNPMFADYLIKTGDRVLVEASPVDIIWGIGLAQDSDYIDNIYAWRGLNLLGFVLMEVRDFLKEFGHFKPPDHTLPAPWHKFPTVDKNDMFWKMGKGMDYLMQFHTFYGGLSGREKTIFNLTNPVPYEWEGFYSS